MFCSLLPVLGLKDFIKSGADSTVDNIYKQMSSVNKNFDDLRLKC
jgi:hypothetical protein